MKKARLSRPVLLAAALAAGSGSVEASPKGDRAFGEYLSAECVTCHQVTGRATGGIPPIVAWPEDQFIAVMQSYKSKDRDNNVMQAMAGRLSEDEIAALATYFGSLPIQPLGN